MSYAMSVTDPNGAVIIRVDDGATSRCINSTNDKISIHLRHLSVTKDISWFTEDTAVGIKLDTTFEGTSGERTQKVTFPRLFQTSVQKFADGIVTLPVEIKLINNFPLSQGDTTYDSIGIEFVVLKKKDKNQFGTALSALQNISNKLPIPSNPYSDGFKFFTEYANQVVNNSLDKANGVSETLKEGIITLSFSPTDTCIGDQEKTGSIVVVKGIKAQGGGESDGYVDINKTYCWRVNYNPFDVKFSSLPPNGKEGCQAVPDGHFTTLQNPYYLFVVVAVPKVIKPSSAPVARIENLSAQPSGKVKGETIKTSLDSIYTPDKIASISKVSNINRVIGDNNKRLAQGKERVDIENQNSVIWQAPQANAAIHDVSESLKRCQIHGISPKDCF